VVKITEKQFRQTVIDLAKINGWDYYFTWNSQHSPAGMPDLILVRPPEILVCELKSNDGKVTKMQQKWLDYFRDCGVTTHVWKPDQWEEIVECLKR
jgi:hypothetical protein